MVSSELAMSEGRAAELGAWARDLEENDHAEGGAISELLAERRRAQDVLLAALLKNAELEEQVRSLQNEKQALVQLGLMEKELYERRIDELREVEAELERRMQPVQETAAAVHF